ncbi:SEC10/PgrA surface exclusion domain-containing protein [Apilactobacillus kunkeei]|uniref:SEC10/PgrA surface exclusion domain-containing protein n=1 Tax=Apilactobacillus kunkeei TaxID=148814 RepID=UPI00110C9B3C|nr:SEC10/PgrA surface exclusion domain-containing protein [Apilactobacillus kunkeei]TMT01330.1 SEC10/PgrA surface exclusion domain-containing protein [Apilactobacillus kunkeei]
MKKTIKMIAAAALIGSVIASSAPAVTTHASSIKKESSLIKKFKQQTTDDAKIATTKSISKLTTADLNNFIPTQAMKVTGNQVTDPGSDANFVTKINYKATKNPKNVIKLPKGYTNAALKKAASEKSIGNYKLQVAMGKIGLKGLAMNSFTPSKKDLSRNVNLNKMTYSQRKELTKFALSILNPAIKQAKGIQYKSSKNTIAVAQTFADVYSKDNWNNTGKKTGHDLRTKTVASKKYNISDVAEENYSDNPSFALTSTKIKKRVVSMAALKHAVYNSIALQLFEDGPSYWGHATALMNLDIHKKYQPNYFAVSFDKFGGIHFVMVPHNKLVNKKYVPGTLV